MIGLLLLACASTHHLERLVPFTLSSLLACLLESGGRSPCWQTRRPVAAPSTSIPVLADAPHPWSLRFTRPPPLHRQGPLPGPTVPPGLTCVATLPCCSVSFLTARAPAHPRIRRYIPLRGSIFFGSRAKQNGIRIVIASYSL